MALEEGSLRLLDKTGGAYGVWAPSHCQVTGGPSTLGTWEEWGLGKT